MRKTVVCIVVNNDPIPRFANHKRYAVIGKISESLYSVMSAFVNNPKLTKEQVVELVKQSVDIDCQRAKFIDKSIIDYHVSCGEPTIGQRRPGEDEHIPRVVVTLNRDSGECTSIIAGALEFIVHAERESLKSEPT